MHILRALVGFLGLSGWFPNFGDFAKTAAQNTPTSSLDSITTLDSATDEYKNWSFGVLMPDVNKVFITPQFSNSLTNHGNRGLIYDIATDSYSYSPTFTVPLGGAANYWMNPGGVLLKSGKVLISPGMYAFNGSPSIPFHIYDPTTNTLQTVPSPNNSVYISDLVRLPNDDIFCLFWDFGNVVGGYIFNPETLTFTATPTLFGERGIHHLMVLPDGRLLISSSRQNGVAYDYLTNTVSSTSLPQCSSAGLTHDGRVFYMRGYTIPGFVPTLQDSNGYVWNPSNGAISMYANVFTFETSNSRAYGAGILMLPDGRLLLSSYQSDDTYARMLNLSTGIVTNVPGPFLRPIISQVGSPRCLVPLTNGKVLFVTSQRRGVGNKFQLISGAFSTATQFPLRQLKGGYLKSSTIYPFADL